MKTAFGYAELALTLFEESADALILFDPETEQILDVNPFAQRLTGYTRRELRSVLITDLFRSDKAGGLNHLRRAYQKTSVFHSQEGFWIRQREQGWLPVNLSITRLHLDGQVLGLVTARDVSEMHAVRKQLEQREAELRHILNSVSDFLWSAEIDTKGVWKMRYISSVVERLTGRSPEFFHNSPEAWLSILHPEDRPLMAQRWAQVRSGEVEHVEDEYRVVRPDGQVRWLRDSVSVQRQKDGRLMVHGVVSDVTERRKILEQLRYSEAKYRALIENLEQCVFLKNRELRFAAVNPRFCEAVGKPEHEILGKTDYDFYPPHLAEKYRADDMVVLTTGQTLELEEENVSEGRTRLVRVVKRPMRDEQGNIVGVLGIFWDITHQRALEEQLRHAQKMEAVGQLAGGVAHDFNNLLTAILGNVSLVLARLAPDDPNRELLQITEKAALRAAELTRQLLSFSRRTRLRPQPTEINPIVEETLSLLRRTIDKRVEIQSDLDPQCGKVHADAGQMQQVLMNLCLNARDAMPEGGKLLVRTRRVVLSAEDARRHVSARPGIFVRLDVVDTGHGIPPEIRSRIFEPFFTTKGQGRGTGLGLAMVYGIIEEHHGWIEVESEVGRGSTFSVFLPVHGLEELATGQQPTVAADGAASVSPP
ncbi:Sensor kinase CckA [bacterium HR36]|uniref:histidine kinase n=1 Tax=uncultured Planctomycetota bacterium TaxID=120965 RepID=H5S883_9BACT|nr:multi-sensor hybrid histidine kinase [uncultured Planctomycetota bacterium]GBD36241.1 Sensor kinase CckA [bacterium HR36]